MSPPPRDEWIEHLLDVLSPLGRVGARRFFGGHGLTLAGEQFAFASDGVLYLRADRELAAELEALGAEPFSYETRVRKVSVKSYWSVPGAGLDDADQLVVWAKRAAAVKRSRSRTRARARRGRRARSGRATP
ncbi:MAG TPA: TfoX/Sxy family protein [Myxococcota bacterium]|nr:TfoX/Sxy family protein [Myxococcota bacterium]